MMPAEVSDPDDSDPNVGVAHRMTPRFVVFTNSRK
jgi:hypothetical protein